MDQDDAFRGSPWNAKPTEEWNQPPFWTSFYHGLLAEADSRDRRQVVHRRVDLLIKMLTRAGELPMSSPQKLLDAGCGIALIPHFLAFLGFQVTAVDSSPDAIEVVSAHRPSEEELARCVPILDPCTDMPGAYQLVQDPARSLQQLRSLRAPGGSATFLTADWLAADLQPGTFGLVHCRNSLRCSTKPYWRRSLHRFHELLAPGGVLLLENVNAIGIRNEVEDLLTECAFVPLASRASRELSTRYVTAMWPTG
jgi:SAM-dependent methyltransferase